MFLLVLVLGIVITGHTQTVTKDSMGNYHPTKVARKILDTVHYKTTGKSFITNKGDKYPVYESPTGSIYIVRTSKNGNQYRQYLKVGQ